MFSVTPCFKKVRASGAGEDHWKHRDTEAQISEIKPWVESSKHLKVLLRVLRVSVFQKDRAFPEIGNKKKATRDEPPFF
ncbi:MAG: hypothetical protein RL240_4057 [Planctomycetota bacterium]